MSAPGLADGINRVFASKGGNLTTGIGFPNWEPVLAVYEMNAKWAFGEIACLRLQVKSPCLGPVCMSRGLAAICHDH